MITRIKFIGLLFIFILIGIAQGETKEVTKSFKLDKSEIERLVPDIGFAYATDMITIEGKKVDYMVRQNPEREGDSGWIFYGGGETQEYMDNSDNISIYSVNTIANYDPEIIEYLTYPPGTEIERNREGQLQVISKDVSKPDVIFFYPLNEGIAQITESWSFEISTRMLRRYDKGSLVIWRPGFTIWLNAYSPNNIAIEERAEKILETMSSDNQDLLKETKNGIQKIRYRLVEEIEGIKQSSAYIFGLTDNQEIHITIYYDDPKHMVDIEQIWDTLRCKCT